MNDPSPTADIVPVRRFPWVWLPPLIALALVVVAAWTSWNERGVPISIDFQHGHGIKPGDILRHRGITAGAVEAVRLSDDLTGVTIDVRLDGRAQGIAHAGSRFWVVRPQIGLSGIVGLDTVVGARYLAVQPGDPEGPRESEFTGLEDPPVLDTVEPGSLEIILEARERGSLSAGAPLTYRGIEVGRVISVRLESDGPSVEVRVSVEAPYLTLIRSNTRFWDTGGLLIDIGLSGVSVEIDSLEAFVAGGIALATPNAAGDLAVRGARFRLHGQPQEEWLDWRPPLPLGDPHLPGVELPKPLSVVMHWQEGRILKSDEARVGWVLPVPGGLLGPSDLFAFPDDAREDSFALRIHGDPAAPPPQADVRESGLTMAPIERGDEVWPAERMRRVEVAEDCLVIGDAAAAPLALSAVRLQRDDKYWSIDSRVSFARDTHGAAVVARSDGQVVGLLIIEGGNARIAPVL